MPVVREDVSANYFDVLGVHTIAGSGFSAADDRTWNQDEEQRDDRCDEQHALELSGERAVERACGPAGRCPMITLGAGLDSAADETTSEQVARLVHRVLSLVPFERLSSAHVAVTRDPKQAIPLAGSFTGKPGDFLGTEKDLATRLEVIV